MASKSKDDVVDAISTTLVSSTVQSMLRRMVKIDDPILRYRLFIEILRLLIDTIVCCIHKANEEKIYEKEDTLEDALHKQSNESDEGNEDEKKISPLEIRRLQRELNNLRESHENVMQIANLLNEYFDGFTSWISSPMYSPDHPYGTNVMSASKNHFEENTKKQ